MFTKHQSEIEKLAIALAQEELSVVLVDCWECGRRKGSRPCNCNQKQL